MLLMETFLQGMEFVILLQTFNGHDLATICLDGEHGTGFRGLAVDENGAGSTCGSVTTNMGTRQAQSIANPVYEQHS
jgi:hypothetical protein